MTVHMTPGHGEPTTPCCNLSPLELPLDDRLTIDSAAVSCSATEGGSVEDVILRTVNWCRDCGRIGGHFTHCPHHAHGSAGRG